MERCESPFSFRNDDASKIELMPRPVPPSPSVNRPELEDDQLNVLLHSRFQSKMTSARSRIPRAFSTISLHLQVFDALEGPAQDISASDRQVDFFGARFVRSAMVGRC